MPPPAAGTPGPVVDASGPVKSTRAAPSSRPARATAGRSVAELAKIIVGGIAGLILAVLILNYLSGIDLLGWSASARKEEAEPKKVAVKVPRKVQSPPSTNGKRSSPSAESRDPPLPDQGNPTSPVAPPKSSANPTSASRPPEVSPSPSINSPPDQTPPRSLADLANQNGNPSSAPPVKKSPAPSADEQATKLAAIKEIYKTEFAAASKPGGAPEFPEFLLRTAVKVEGDPVARYVLYAEAYHQACGASDILTAAETLDKLETEFEEQPFPRRFELLTKMATVAKSSDERESLARAALELVDHALAQGKIEEADKLARIADTQTKIIIDKELRAKAIATLQTTSDLSKDFAAVAKARETLAQTPDDPAANLAVGRYRCLVEGNWKEGIPHLTKSDDSAIKAAAEQDQAGPAGDVTAGALGDTWYDLAKGGKGTNFYGRADFWYQQAMAGESGLALVRLKKRREEIASLKLPPRVLEGAQEELPCRSAREMVLGGEQGGTTDLLALINPQTAKPNSWDKSGGVWTSPAAAQGTAAFLETTFQPPRREYSLQARIRRSSQSDPKGRPAGGVIFGLTHKGKRFALVIDELAADGQRLSYLTMGSAPEAKNPSVVRYSQMRLRSDDVVCNVASDKITVHLNGTLLLQYQGDMSVLALPPGSPFLPAKPFFYAQDRGINVIDRWGISPLAQPGAQSDAPQVKSNKQR